MIHFGPTPERRKDKPVVVYQTKDKQWCACPAYSLMTDKKGSSVFSTKDEAIKHGKKLSRGA